MPADMVSQLLKDFEQKDCFMKIHLTAAENDENTFLKGMIVTIAFVSTKSTCLQCVRGSHGN